MLSAVFVAARIIANPVSNALQKELTRRASSPVFIIAATHALLSIACIPVLFGAVETASTSEFWTNMAICAVLAVSSNVLLVYALQSADLSVLGPINAYKSVISLGLGVVLLREIPSALGMVGVLLILAGSYFVLDREAGQPRTSAFTQFFRTRGIQLRLAALVLSATEAVFLKKAILASSPLATFVWWSMLGFPIASAAAWVLLRGRLASEFVRMSRNRGTHLWLALTTGVMQLTTLLAFGRLQVGYSLALFQLSALVSVLLGHRYFQEGNIARRLVGSGVMIVGAALIVVHGRHG